MADAIRRCQVRLHGHGVHSSTHVATLAGQAQTTYSVRGGNGTVHTKFASVVSRLAPFLHDLGEFRLLKKFAMAWGFIVDARTRSGVALIRLDQRSWKRK